MIGRLNENHFKDWKRGGCEHNGKVTIQGSTFTQDTVIKVAMTQNLICAMTRRRLLLMFTQEHAWSRQGIGLAASKSATCDKSCGDHDSDITSPSLNQSLVQ